MTDKQKIVYSYLKKEGYATNGALFELHNIIKNGDLDLFVEIAQEK
jgi:hypothetical protein